MFRGLLRDLISLYIGIRLVLSVAIPLTTKDLVLMGFATLFFPIWFLMERMGLL